MSSESKLPRSDSSTDHESKLVDETLSKPLDDDTSHGHEDSSEQLRSGSHLEKITNVDPFLVTWEDNEPENPLNWSDHKKWPIALGCGFIVLNATFSSSAPSGSIPAISKDLGMTTFESTLMLSLFILGYALGPMVWGPLSEIYGRRPVYLVSFGAYLGWQIGSALAPNKLALLIFRTLAGSFAAGCVTLAGATIADMFVHRQRGRAMTLVTLTPFAGPALGPTIGGYLYVHRLSWRWVYWIMVIYTAISMLFVIFLLPETYAPVLLKEKAARLRAKTGDERYYASIECVHFSLRDLAVKVLGRPVKMLITEPMLASNVMYISFNYGCLYLLFEAYPVIFVERHHLNQGAAGLMFVPLFLGGAVAIIAFLTIFEPRYLRKVSKGFVTPEDRLEPALWGAPLYVISFFWLGWTSYPQISYWVPMMSGLISGCAITFIFTALLNHMLEVYLPVAASAIAAQTVVRSTAGVGFPLFAPAMFTKLGPQWACTLLGFIAMLCAFIPFMLLKWGPILRAKSKYRYDF